MAVRVGGVALGLLVIALVVRFAVADREHQPGLIAPGSSTAQAGWQPGEYQHSVAPCQAVSGSLLGRVVLHERNALVDIQYQDSSRSPDRAVLQQAAIAVADDVIRHLHQSVFLGSRDGVIGVPYGTRRPDQRGMRAASAAGLAAYQARRTQRRLANQLRYVRSGRASRWPLDPV